MACSLCAYGEPDDCPECNECMCSCRCEELFYTFDDEDRDQ